MEETFTVSVTTNDKTEETKYTITKDTVCIKCVNMFIIGVFICCLLVIPFLHYFNCFYECFGKKLCMIFLVIVICLIVIVLKQLLTYNIKKEKISLLKDLFYLSEIDCFSDKDNIGYIIINDKKNKIYTSVSKSKQEKEIINCIANAVQEV